MSVRIGIDVGGTNTDVVLLDGKRVVASVKSSTQPDVTDGIVASLLKLQERGGYAPERVDAVMIGTTHFINALLERRQLVPTAAIRLGLPATTAAPPMVEWPSDLVSAIAGRHYFCHGGHEYDGRVITPVSRDEILAIADDIEASGIRSVAITSVFSPVNAEAELEAAAILSERLPNIYVSLSHEIGRIGLLERENATIINAALRDLADRVVGGLAESLARLGFGAQLYLSQNDGTLMDVAYAQRYPVSTFASGPTNSMRGAAFLSGVEDCAVIDVGGTTSDIGMLVGGFPRESNSDVVVAGVRTNFRAPDVLSLAIGGGSRIRPDTDSPVGPDSVGFELTKKAKVFGGDVLTATDIAVAAGLADIGDPGLVRGLDRSMVARVHEWMTDRISEGIDRMRLSAATLPIVAVGGGSVLLPERLGDVGVVSRPTDHAVANAVGAAIGQIGGEVDRVYSVEPGKRDAILDAAKQEAFDRAVFAGARPSTVRIVDVDEVALAYLPGNASRIRVKAVGDLALAKRATEATQEGTPA